MKFGRLISHDSHGSPTARTRWIPLLLLVGLGGPLIHPTTSFGQASEVETKDEQDFDLDLQLETFDQVWETVRDRHYDPELGGVDWDAVKEELRPKMEKSESIEEGRKILREMLGRLGQSHYGILPAKAYENLNADPSKNSDGDIGLRMRLVDGEILVASVREGSPSADAGIKSGWQVVRLGKKTGEEIIEAATEAAEGPARIDTMVGLATEQLQAGDIGTVLELEIVDAEGEAKTVEIERAASPGKMAKFGHLPPMRVYSDARMIDDRVSYFYFNMFFDPPTVMKKLQTAVESARDAQGLIIDLRGNIGGIGAMTMGMGGWFVTERSELGVMQMRGSSITFALLPRAKPYQGPVAVLIDECSISSAEILSGGLKDQKLARVFGKTSAGLALPSNVGTLPNGDRFQYVVAGYTSASGESLEGIGVIPDEPIELSKESLLNETDPVLNAAIKWIESQSN